MRLALPIVVVAFITLAAPRPTSAAPLPWWVDDAAAAAAVREALDALWPGHAVEVVVGAPTVGADGVRSDGEDLVLVLGGVPERLQPGDEPAVQVALVRAIHRRWVTAAPPPRERVRPGPFIAARVGGGGRGPGEATVASPSMHLGARLGVDGRFWTVAAAAGLRLGEVAEVAGARYDGESVFLGGVASARAVTPPGLVVEGGIGGGVRLMTWADRAEEVFRRRGIVPGVDIFATLWAPSIAGVAAGGGVRLEIDARRLLIEADAGSAELAPMLIVVEFSVRASGVSTFFEGTARSRH